MIINGEITMTKKDKEEKYSEGIILSADYGFGMKYTDKDSMYLKLEIQEFNGNIGVQLFSQEKIGKLLLQFNNEYRGEVSLSHLKHRRVFLSDKTTNGVPDAIAKMPPELYPQYNWVENDNWN